LELHAGIGRKSECDIASGNASNLNLESGFRKSQIGKMGLNRDS
jgi:hypothetical protein